MSHTATGEAPVSRQRKMQARASVEACTGRNEQGTVSRLWYCLVVWHLRSVTGACSVRTHLEGGWGLGSGLLGFASETCVCRPGTG